MEEGLPLLIVEPHREMQTLLQHFFARQQVAVQAVPSVAAAMAFLAQRPVRVVLTDLFLPDAEGIAKALREPLLKVFPPALLGRIVTIPYYPLSDQMLGAIIRLQIGRIKKRIEENHAVSFTYSDEVVGLVSKRCTELESGGRMIDAILTNTVLPRISEEFLKRMMAGEPVSRVTLSVASGDFAYNFS